MISIKSIMFLAVLFSIVWLLPYTKGSNSCTDTNCNGPFRLKRYYMNASSVEADTKGTLAEIQDKVEGVMMEKKSVKFYCYNGGALDHNTGCDTTRLSHNISSEEFKLKKCKVSYILGPGDAESTDAQKCFQDYTQYIGDRDGRFFNWVGQASFAYHMCVMDWRCKIHIATFPLHVNMDDKLVVSVYTFDRIGKEVVLAVGMEDGEGGVKVNAEMHDGDFSISIDDTLVAVRRDVKASCNYNHKEQRLMCIHNNIVFNMYCDEHICRGTTKRFVLTVDHVKDYITHKETHELIDKAASIADLVEVAKVMTYSQSNTDFNLEIIKSDIYDLYNVIDTMVESLGKLDDELIPHIMGKKGKTIWLNPVTFKICPCFPITIPETGNCNKGYIYDNGRIKKINDDITLKRTCTTFADDSRELMLFKGINITINELVFEPPEGISADWEGWTWISESKQNFTNAIQFVDSTHDENSAFYGVFNSTGLFGFWNKFSFIFTSTFLTYLNTLLLVYLFIKI